MKFYKLLFLSVFGLAGSGLAEAAVPQSERDALLALYAATGGSHWHNKTAWNDAAGTECTWYGVSCDSGQTTVIGLSLKANNLKGPLPAKLTQLTHLIGSDFRYNAVYSTDPALIEFLDATGPIGSLPDTQTLDADGIVFSNVTATGFDVNWNPAAYSQAGGYRVYMAEQIDSDTGSVMTDFVQVAEVNDKASPYATLTGLVACRQYFVKVVSYTDAHDGNAEVQSDGISGPIIGTIPGYTDECTIIGSTYNDSFYLDAESPVMPAVVIDINHTADRTYYLRGDHVWFIDGSAGIDKLTVLGSGNNTWVLDSENGSKVNANGFSNIESFVGGSGRDSFLILAYSGDILTIDGGIGDDMLTGSNSPNDWSITGSDAGTLNGSVGFSNFQNLNGGSGSDLFTIYPGGNISGTLNIDLNDAVTHAEWINQDGVFEIIGSVEITPVFSSGPGEHDVSENTETGEVIVTFTSNRTGGLSITASRFSITKGNDDGIFKIDSDSGDISLVRPLDYETATRHELEISYYFGELGPMTATVIINVTDAAESGGCSLRAGTPFDPLWLLMLVTAGIYRMRKSKPSN